MHDVERHSNMGGWNIEPLHWGRRVTVEGDTLVCEIRVDVCTLYSDTLVNWLTDSFTVTHHT